MDRIKNFLNRAFKPGNVMTFSFASHTRTKGVKDEPYDESLKRKLYNERQWQDLKSDDTSNYLEGRCVTFFYLGHGGSDSGLRFGNKVHSATQWKKLLGGDGKGTVFEAVSVVACGTRDFVLDWKSDTDHRFGPSDNINFGPREGDPDAIASGDVAAAIGMLNVASAIISHDRSR